MWGFLHLPVIFISGLTGEFNSEKIVWKGFLLKEERKDLLRKVCMNKWECQVNSAFPSELY